MDLYVYYRVPAVYAELLLPRIAAMQAGLAEHFKLATALKRRPETQNDTQTWMEIYMALPAEVAEDFIAEMELQAEQTGLSGLMEGCRHIERFVDIVPCA